MALRTLSFICVMAWTVLAATPAVAQQAPPPQEPILRIDPGMHTAAIRRIGVNAGCTLLATASDDKTVRLWRLPEGRLLRVLRLPIGPGNDGKVHAVAVAPDGSWVAAGGWDAARKNLGGDFVYIFQGSTGAIIARLGPLTSTIQHLAVSPDGRYLAATLWGGQGLRVWERTGADLASWRLVAEDRDYGGRGGTSLGAAFSRDGVLYTVADDGKLRRYAPGYRTRPTWVVTRGGKRPSSVAVHPSGDRLAVGYEDTIAVEVYDAATLARRFAADIKEVNNGELGAVAWSADGAQLYAGGTFARVVAGVDKGSPILVWDRAGQGRRRELDGPQSTVVHLLPCGGDLAFGAQDPAFGVLAPDGSRRLWQEGVQADLRIRHGMDEAFSVAADGRRIRFGLEAGGKKQALFDLAAEQLIDAPNRLADLIGPDTTSLPIAGWIDNPNTKLDGVPIVLEPLEWSRSLAVAPDKQHFVLGTEWFLRSYDRNAKQLWRKQAPGHAWAVNIPRNGNFVVAGYGDGTIRWHRLSDGEELLALFVHKVDRRWVAWTPKGYYMASPGAEGLIGWHVNRGWDEAAQFFPVDHFREQFNRPDIVKGVLETLDEGKAIQAANQRANVKRAVEDVRKIAPPIVVIQNPGDGSSFRAPEVTIEYNVFSPTGKKITGVQHLVNSAAVRAPLPLPVDVGEFSSGRVTLSLPPEDTTITLVAYEGTKASEPVSIRLRWDGAKRGQIALPRLRALFVGVNQYASSGLTKLDFAAKDATDLAAFFKGQEGKSYSKVETKALPDAKRLDVLDGLEWLESGSEEGGVNLLFLAGHGVTDDQNHFYYMAADSDPDKARGTGVSRDELLRTIRNLKGMRVVMLDACHSGASVDAAPAAQSRVDMNRLANELGDRSLGVLLYASARGRQLSYEGPKWRNGAFTRAMLDGLAGAADRDGRGFVETDELAVYVRRRVMEMTSDLQEPVRVKPDAAAEMKIVRLK